MNRTLFSIQACSPGFLALLLLALVSCKTTDTGGEPQVVDASTVSAPAANEQSAAGSTPAANGQSATATVITPKYVPPVDKPKKTINPNDPRSVIYLGSDGKLAGVGDPNSAVSDAYRLGQGATAPALTAPNMPKDKFGLIDWLAMVDKGLIKPSGTLTPGEEEMPALDMDVLIQTKSNFVDDVLFRHSSHTYWLSCEACHTNIFVMAKGENNITMQGISQGKWCGQCHGRVSFPLADCKRCHSQAKALTGAKK